MSSIRHWILKSEPTEYSFDDLMAEEGQTTPWDGIRNYQARNFIRDTMGIGDEALFYHSSTKHRAVVGRVEIVSAAYADSTQFEPESRYFDPKSTRENPRWVCRDVRAVAWLERPVRLEQIRAAPELAGCTLVARGNRLSVFPITDVEYEAIIAMSHRG